MPTPTLPIPLLVPRSVIARIAFSDPAGWLYIAFSPLLANVGGATAHDVHISLHPLDAAMLEDAGCQVWAAEPMSIHPRVQTGDATLIAVERDLATGLHAQHVASRSLPELSFTIGIPLDALAELPPGWLPLFETHVTSRDLDRPGIWETGVPSDLVFGVCHYAYEPRDDAHDAFDHFVGLPFDTIYVPQGWTPPPALVDTDDN